MQDRPVTGDPVGALGEVVEDHRHLDLRGRLGLRGHRIQSYPGLDLLDPDLDRLDPDLDRLDPDLDHLDRPDHLGPGRLGLRHLGDDRIRLADLVGNRKDRDR